MNTASEFSKQLAQEVRDGTNTVRSLMRCGCRACKGALRILEETERKDEIRRYNRIYSRGYDAAIRKTTNRRVECPGLVSNEACAAMACPVSSIGFGCTVLVRELF